jgi:hypothetical protein
MVRDLTLAGLFLTAAAAAAAAAWGGFAASRDWSTDMWNDWDAATTSERDLDPERRLTKAERELKGDLPQLEATRRELNDERQDLSVRKNDEQCRYDCCVTVIKEFREAYKEAEARDAFPIVVRDAAYTQTQAERQVEMLVAEAKERGVALEKMHAALQSLDSRLIELVTAETQAKQELLLLPLKRTMVAADKLADHAKQAVTTAERTVGGPAGAAGRDPVRTLDELLKAESSAASKEVKRLAADILK